MFFSICIFDFSYTFTVVQENTDKHWFFQRYSLIYEYYTRPILFPPLIFLSHVYLLLKYIVLSCCCCKKDNGHSEDNDFRKYPPFSQIRLPHSFQSCSCPWSPLITPSVNLQHHFKPRLFINLHLLHFLFVDGSLIPLLLMHIYSMYI